MLLLFVFIVDVGPISEDAFRVLELFIDVMNCTCEIWVLGFYICLHMRIIVDLLLTVVVVLLLWSCLLKCVRLPFVFLGILSNGL